MLRSQKSLYLNVLASKGSRLTTLTILRLLFRSDSTKSASVRFESLKFDHESGSPKSNCLLGLFFDDFLVPSTKGCCVVMDILFKSNSLSIEMFVAVVFS